VQKYLLFDLADSLVKTIYLEAVKLPHEYQSSIGDQLKRASLSVVLNIVEAGARRTAKEKRQLLSYAFGSLKETKYLIFFTHDLKLINEGFFRLTMEKVNRLARVLYGLLYKSRTYNLKRETKKVQAET